MFKVNNIDTKTTSLISLLFFEGILHLFPSFFLTDDLEQLNVNWTAYQAA